MSDVLRVNILSIEIWNKIQIESEQNEKFRWIIADANQVTA